MTDPRMGDGLWEALARLPRGAGVVFRHYDLPPGERRALFARIRKLAGRRGLVVVRAGDTRLGRGEQGVHGCDPHRAHGLRTWPAHNRREIIAGIKAGADLIFLSPLFPTRSHPGAPALGRVRALTMKHGVNVPVVALGGIGPRDARWLGAAGFHGWAGIDAWLDQA